MDNSKSKWILTGICLSLMLLAIGVLVDVSIESSDDNNEESEKNLDQGSACETYIKSKAYRKSDTYGEAGKQQGRYVKITNFMTEGPYGNARDACELQGVSSEYTQHNLSAWTWAWGEFIMHDIVKTVTEESVTDKNGIKTLVNKVTSFIDGSMLYGSDGNVREHVDGKVRMSETEHGALLPLDESDMFFVTGDNRARENAALSALYTLFAREHNYWANIVKGELKSEDDALIFEQTKKIIVAELQSITYNEYLPALFGENTTSESPKCYDENVDPRVYAEFSAAAFQLMPTMVNEVMFVMDTVTGARKADFLVADTVRQLATESYAWENGIDGILLGLSRQKAFEIDRHTNSIDACERVLETGAQSELPAYGLVRYHFNEHLSSLPNTCETYAASSLWLGLMCESHALPSALGRTLHAIIKDQFTRIQRGDPNFYAYNTLMHARFRHLRLTDILRRNTAIDLTLLYNSPFVYFS